MTKKLISVLLTLVSLSSFADTPPPGTVFIKGGTDSTKIGNTGDSLKVSGTTSVSGNVTVVQPTGTNLHTVVDSSALPSGAAQDSSLSTINTTLGSPFQAGGSIGNSSFGISGTLPSFGSTQTFNLGTLNGASTAANQSTEITALGTINTTLGSPFQAGGSIGNSSFGISGTLPAFASTPTVNLGTISTASTAANQSTEITALGTINTTLGTPMQNSGGSVTANAGTNLNTSALNLESTQSAFKTANHSDLGTINTTLGTPMQNSGGSVTANAGTNLNTSALALESGGHLASIDTKLTAPLTVNGASGRTSISLVRNVYSSINVTTSAYVQLIASTSDIVNYLDVFDSSGQTLAIAVGASGFEVNQFYLVPGGNGPVPLYIPSGSRVSVIAVSGTANAGELDITFYK